MSEVTLGDPNSENSPITAGELEIISTILSNGEQGYRCSVPALSPHKNDPRKFLSHDAKIEETITQIASLFENDKIGGAETAKEQAVELDFTNWQGENLRFDQGKRLLQAIVKLRNNVKQVVVQKPLPSRLKDPVMQQELRGVITLVDEPEEQVLRVAVIPKPSGKGFSKSLIRRLFAGKN